MSRRKTSELHDRLRLSSAFEETEHTGWPFELFESSDAEPAIVVTSDMDFHDGFDCSETTGRALHLDGSISKEGPLQTPERGHSQLYQLRSTENQVSGEGEVYTPFTETEETVDGDLMDDPIWDNFLKDLRDGPETDHQFFGGNDISNDLTATGQEAEWFRFCTSNDAYFEIESNVDGGKGRADEPSARPLMSHGSSDSSYGIPEFMPFSTREPLGGEESVPLLQNVSEGAREPKKRTLNHFEPRIALGYPFIAPPESEGNAQASRNSLNEVTRDSAHALSMHGVETMKSSHLVESNVPIMAHVMSSPPSDSQMVSETPTQRHVRTPIEVGFGTYYSGQPTNIGQSNLQGQYGLVSPTHPQNLTTMLYSNETTSTANWKNGHVVCNDNEFLTSANNEMNRYGFLPLQMRQSRSCGAEHLNQSLWTLPLGGQADPLVTKDPRSHNAASSVLFQHHSLEQSSNVNGTRSQDIVTKEIRLNIMTDNERTEDDERPNREKEERAEKRRRIAQAPIKVEGFPDGNIQLPESVWENGQDSLVRRYPNHLYGEYLKRLVQVFGWTAKELADRAGGGGKITRNAMGKRVAKVTGRWKGGKKA